MEINKINDISCSMLAVTEVLGVCWSECSWSHVNPTWCAQSLNTRTCQAKYMVRSVSWWTWTALANAWWSRPLLCPEVWLPSALQGHRKEREREHNTAFVWQMGDDDASHTWEGNSVPIATIKAPALRGISSSHSSWGRSSCQACQKQPQQWPSARYNTHLSCSLSTRWYLARKATRWA